MREPTDYPTVTVDGRTYAMVPVEDLTELVRKGGWVPDEGVPLEVVRHHIEGGVSKARAWREYLGLSQQVVAERMGVTQAALSQIENAKRPRRETLAKLGEALGVTVEQLRG
jgi:DNA-binding XRE family transcriptional regulator